MVICGAVMRMIRNGEESDQRDRDRGHRRDPRRPQRFQELDDSLHRHPTPVMSPPGKNCPVHGYRRVNVGPVRTGKLQDSYSMTSTTSGPAGRQ